MGRLPHREAGPDRPQHRVFVPEKRPSRTNWMWPPRRLERLFVSERPPRGPPACWPTDPGGMKNLLENALRDALGDLASRTPDFCGCDRCRDDVMAYALNKMRPRYTAGGDLGVALAHLDLQRDNARATIAVTILEGIRKVGANPHRLQDGMGRREGRDA